MSTETLGTEALPDVEGAPGEGPGESSASPEEARAGGGPGGRGTDEVHTEAGGAELPQLGLSEPALGPARSIEALAEVHMTISVELGRTKLLVRDLLNIHNGAVVQLDRQVTQPVDVFVHGTLIARGEVVVVDECFAVRVTELVAGD